MPIELNCVFQGGGARLVTLLAATEALEDLQSEGRLVVREVAGTSAGSIAAYSFACKKPVEVVRTRMKNAANDVIQHFDKKHGKLDLAWKIFKGSSVYDEEHLKRFVRKIFTESSSERPKLSDAEIPVHIRVADVKNGGKHTYTRENGGSLEDALVDSCAIPIAFRTHRHNSSFADGGVVSNLAGPEIFNDHSRKVLAFSFPKSEPYSFSDAPTYLMSLAATAIDNSVDEAREKILAHGGFVCELPNDFKTFDFKKALNKGLDDDVFLITKNSVRQKIIDALQYFEREERALDLVGDLTRVQDFASKMMDQSIKRFPFSVQKCGIVCIADGLDSSSDRSNPRPDAMVKELEIIPTGGELFSFRIGITKEEAFELGNDISWVIRDVNGIEIEPDQSASIPESHDGTDNIPVTAIHEVVQSLQDGLPVWHSCFCLSEPIPAERCPLKIVMRTTHIGLMKNLLVNGQNEWMRTSSGQVDNIESQDFVFASPKSSGSFVMTDLLANIHRATIKPSKSEEMAESWCRGQAMTDSELRPYRGDSLNLSGYTVIGWRCRDMPPKSYGGALIERAS